MYLRVKAIKKNVTREQAISKEGREKKKEKKGRKKTALQQKKGKLKKNKKRALEGQILF